jgi:hypothetical protein
MAVGPASWACRSGIIRAGISVRRKLLFQIAGVVSRKRGKIIRTVALGRRVIKGPTVIWLALSGVGPRTTEAFAPEIRIVYPRRSIRGWTQVGEGKITQNLL